MDCNMSRNSHGLPKIQPLGARWTAAGICAFLVGLVWLVFGQTIHFPFINYDDDDYVYTNPQIINGLSLKSIRWVFTHSHVENWSPLTSISHMLDCQVYGLHPGGHHLTNVLLHAITVVLLFFVLKLMTGAIWRSAFVAAAFAIHPLRVESVAWISERKDVLSGVFFMLTLLAYIRYTQKPPSIFRYLLVAATLALGLMSKPTLVTVPFVLLLLDWWPLHRLQKSEDHELQSRTLQFLFLEKIPLLLLAAAASFATWHAQIKNDSIAPFYRIGNAAVSYVIYLRQMFWPAGLTVLYPHPGSTILLWQVGLSLLLLAIITIAAFVGRKTHPWLLVGWLWYLGMLVPMIGLVQVGLQAHADRHTYLPQIGLALALTWTVADLCPPWHNRRLILGSAMALAIIALASLAFIQTTRWQNSETLWTYTIAHTPPNGVAETKLGNILERKGQFNEAAAHYLIALGIDPDDALAHNNLALVLQKEGRLDEAITHYQSALKLNPGFADAGFNLGNALRMQGHLDEAIAEYRKAVEIKPDYANAQNNLGSALQEQGKTDEAIQHYRIAVESEPGDMEALNNLALALLQTGQPREAVNYFQKILELDPENIQAENNLAFLLATSPDSELRNGPKALTLARQANQLSGGTQPIILLTLAAACAETGKFPEAIATAQKALQLSDQQHNTPLSQTLQSHLKLYQSGQPLRE